VHVYKVTLGKGDVEQVYHLLLPDDEKLRKVAKDLDGQDVVVNGDLQIRLLRDFKKRSGTPFAAGEIQVKSLKRAETPPK
jgi:hypothetical protein